MKKLIQRILSLKRVVLESDASNLFIGKKVHFHIEKGGKLIVEKGAVFLGQRPPATLPMPHDSHTTIVIKKNATVTFKGNVFIGEGSYICVGEDSKLIFEGQNNIGINNKIIVRKFTKFGTGSCTSWNCTFIDDDGHNFFKTNGIELRKISTPLLIGNYVGFQMNVCIPRGVKIGDCCAVGANTVLRTDVDANSIVYNDSKIKIKNNITSGLKENVYALSK